jgi:membrane-associated phospholipid phosphatase
MDAISSLITSLDADAVRATEALRWAPLSALMAVASVAWVKGPLITCVALCADAGGIRDRLRQGLRALIPRSGLAVAAAFGFASVANGLLKGVFERARPPLSAADLTASIDLPASYSFPSGHAMTAFAAATALAVLHPRLRVPALALAGLIAASRPYLGVHYWTDVVVGAALGGLIGYTVARAALALPRRGRAGAGAASGLSRGRSGGPSPPA